MALALLAIPINAGAFTVQTDESWYNPGDEVEIFGEAQVDTYINTTIESSLQERYEFEVDVGENGSYSLIFTLDEDSPLGNYTVKVENENTAVETHFIVSSNKPVYLSARIYDLAISSRNRVRAAYNISEEDIPEASKEQYQRGLDALDDYVNLTESGKYIPAANAAHRALNHFRNALHHLHLRWGYMIPQEGNQTLERYVLENRINHTLLALDKLENCVRIMEEENLNNSEVILELINQTREKLEAAYSSLEDDLSSAKQEFEEAKELIEEIHELIEEGSQSLKPRSMERFQERFHKRLNLMEEAINRLRTRVGEVKADMAIQALRRVEERLGAIQEKLREGDVPGAMEDLRKSTREVEGTLEDLNGNGIPATLKSLNRLRANIQALNRTSEKLERRGLNSTEVQERLQANQGLLNRFMEKLQRGRVEEAKGLFRGNKPFKGMPRGNRGSPSNNKGRGKHP
ncbi:MAG: hypothetical protein ACLFVP_08960 [Candidatus Bathyarchaeia archaeon]